MVEFSPKERRDMKLVVLKAGVALVLSFAGFIYSQIRSRQSSGEANNRPGLGLPSGDHDEGETEVCSELKEDILSMKHEEASPKLSSEKLVTTVAELSPLSRSSMDEHLYLLPEFNELVHNEFESAEKDSIISPSRSSSTITVENQSIGLQQEISELRNLVKSLQERERKLEDQLLEYYGLKEQEVVVKELENHLSVSRVEAKLLALKIESLQANNQKLEAQLSNFSRMVAELEAAKEKLNELKELKLRSDSEHAEEISALGEKVASLQRNIHEDHKHGEDMKHSLKRLKDLENKVTELRDANTRLAQANLELTKQLESNEFLASAVEETSKVANNLKERNTELSDEVEQLQTHRSADVEELVYLRWINACLRYELRNYHPSAGKMAAKDLGKASSPESEEKAKQLILEYAQSGCNDNMLLDFESENSSSSQESSLMQTAEFDDTSSSTKNSTTVPKKGKFLGKFKKLLLGKEAWKKKSSTLDGASSTSSLSSCSHEDLMGRHSFDSPSVPTDLISNKRLLIDSIYEKEHLNHPTSRPSLDIEKLRMLTIERSDMRCKSDLGSSDEYIRFILQEPSSRGFPEKMELKKFAEVLRQTRGKSEKHRRTESCNR